jgi:hypothetical protein
MDGLLEDGDPLPRARIVLPACPQPLGMADELGNLDLPGADVMLQGAHDEQRRLRASDVFARAALARWRGGRSGHISPIHRPTD